ncbi:glycoside hydrolase [Myxococcota bacterium]|nr:glycoside hydrolase [Myxococcota bacterium]
MWSRSALALSSLVVAACTSEVVPAGGLSQVYEGPGGTHVSLALDGEGAPLIAFYREPDADSGGGTILFTKQLPGGATWTTPVAVASDVGEYTSNPGRRSLALARDASTGRLGVAFMKREQFCGPANGNQEWTIHVAFSTDGGATWGASERVSEARYTRNDPEDGVEVCNTRSPRIAMTNGAVHVVWAADAGEMEDLSFIDGYFHAVRTTGDWTRTLLPHDGDDARVGSGDVALAVDAQGRPGVAYVMRATATNQATVLFTRPGGAATRVMHSAGRQNDVPQVAVTFDGTAPRVGAHLAVEGAPRTEWVAKSSDGAIFVASALPGDGHDAGGLYIELIVAAGRTIYTYDYGSGQDDGRCGGPKIATTTDFTSWSICGADDESRQFLGEYLSAEADADGKLVAAFYEDSADTAASMRFGPGIVLYRER